MEEKIRGYSCEQPLCAMVCYFTKIKNSQGFRVTLVLGL